MPEFPEVFTITQNLKELLPNAKLVAIEILDFHPKVPKEKEFNSIINQKVSEVTNISKNIYIKFEKLSLQIHLGMTGRIRFSNEKTNFGWDKIRFEFEKEGIRFYLNFTDTRKFGKIFLIQEIKIKKGLNPLDFTEGEFEKLLEKISRSRKEIKDLILDQSIISGLGNIYSNDTLHLSKLHPQTAGINLTKPDIKNIIQKAKEILEKGIKYGGSSLEDKMYTNIYGELGEYQNHFLVYNQKICPSCNHEITKIKIKGRGTYFCSKCQKLPSQFEPKLY
jgi:formamidopyrimidine-DNA glycosylase